MDKHDSSNQQINYCAYLIHATREICSRTQEGPHQCFDFHAHKINGFKKRKNRVNLCFKVIINLGMIFTFHKVIKFYGGSINFLTLKQPHTRVT